MTLDLDALATVIAEPDPAVVERTRQRLEQLDGPGYGRLLELAAWWAATRGNEHAAPPARVLHLGSAGGQTDPAARPLGPPSLARIEDRPLDASGGLPPDVDAALDWATGQLDAAVDAGADLLLLSVPDPFPGRLMAAALMGLDPVEATGWPDQAGLDDDGWMAEVAALRDGLVGLRPVRGQPVELLRALGHPGIAAGTAALLQAAVRRTAVILDGPGAATVGLLARRAVRACRGWWQAGSGSGQNLHERSLTSLRLEPLVRLDVQREDGTGARLGLAVLEAAAGLLRS